MCGIIGYVGNKRACSILVDGLKRLEYRGYDSVGISILENNSIATLKKVGKVEELVKVKTFLENPGTVGIGHTRWATHGSVNEVNAHPQLSNQKAFAIVHNGIIENYIQIKEFIEGKGYKLQSETDTEVLVNLIEYHYKKSPDLAFVEVVRKALLHIEGTYGLAIVSTHYPDEIVAARKSSPLLIGVGENENIIASDASAVARYTKNVIYLNDGEIASIKANDFNIITLNKEKISAVKSALDWDIHDSELKGYPHYMLKEIYEQAAVIENAMRGRFTEDHSSAKFGGLSLTPEDLRNVDRILFCACGTAYHACLEGKYLIEKYARIPVDVEFASEFRYRNAPLQKNTLVFVVSQSGETIDTLAALKEAKRKGYKVLGITNVVGSTIARESDSGIYQHTGLEMGVASTKAFTAQMTIMSMLALLLGRMRDMDHLSGLLYVDSLRSLPEKVKQVLSLGESIKTLSEKYIHSDQFLFMGRQAMYPIALEGALKLKEIAYVHAEGFPTAEMKHGPIALVSERTTCIFVATQEEFLPKTISNMQEVKARGAKVIAVLREGSAVDRNSYDDAIYIPRTHLAVAPILSVIPLQLFAYHHGAMKGIDVDRPRNLAKSVTVE